MIVSFTNRFIYIAVPRTGSTATYRALQRFGAATVPYGTHPRPCYAQDTNGFHDPLIPEELSSYFVIAGCRNPYTRMVSHYMMAMKDEAHRLHGLAGNVDFRRFVDVTLRCRLLATQSEFLGDRKVDSFVCMEGNIQSQLQQLGVLHPGPVVMDRSNSSVYDQPWYAHYDSATIDAVYAWARNDFDRFGYSSEFADAVECRTPSFPPYSTEPPCELA